MAETHETFDGLFGGANYDRLARLTGYGPTYYRRAARAIPVHPGAELLDLGCGTALLSLALAERLDGRGRVVGIDLSPKQLAHARAKAAHAPVPLELHQGSMRELPFEDRRFDGVVASQVFHALPADVRDAALAETARVLKPGGFFALVEWSRPRLGLTAAIWALSLLGARDGPNWRGAWPELLRSHGLTLVTDVYLDSLNRCQVFVLR